MQPNAFFLLSQILIWVFDRNAVQAATKMAYQLYPGKTYSFYYLNLDAEVVEERMLDESIQMYGIWNQHTTFAELSTNVIDKGIFNIPPIDDIIPTSGQRPTTTVTCSYICSSQVLDSSYLCILFLPDGLQDAVILRIRRLSCHFYTGERDC
jgi:hypothetical protein